MSKQILDAKQLPANHAEGSLYYDPSHVLHNYKFRNHFEFY